MSNLIFYFKKRFGLKKIAKFAWSFGFMYI